MNVVTDAEWLNSHLDDPFVVIIDGRGQMLYRLGHIKNAIPLEISDIIFMDENGSHLVIDSLTARKLFSNLGIDKTKSVVVYGEYPDPSIARIIWTLIYFGHNNVKLLNIGYTQWLNLGFPTSKLLPTQNKIKKNEIGENFVVKMNGEVRADFVIIKEKQTRSDVLIIDSRTPQEHFHARIPGSLLYGWEEGLDFSGKMIKDVDELKRNFAAKGITTDKEVICYCHSGFRASHTFLQLVQAGFNKVRLYDGSIIDWSQRKNPLR